MKDDKIQFNKKAEQNIPHYIKNIQNKLPRINNVPCDKISLLIKHGIFNWTDITITIKIRTYINLRIANNYAIIIPQLILPQQVNHLGSFDFMIGYDVKP